jgi:hypothetical protein
VDRDDIIKMAREAGFEINSLGWTYTQGFLSEHLERFAALVAAHERKAFIEILETYRIPVGNSRSGELACEWTYRALHEIRDEIKARSEQ